jgi:MSHA biogenesis protein MshO
MRLPYRQKGFTLIEMVIVIVILGILATSVTSFIRFGTQGYTDAVDRDELISTARFVIERLNREVRHALPNSIRVTNTNAMQCLEYVPIVSSAVYLDIPVAPDAASNSIDVMMLRDLLPTSINLISIYALNSADIYNKKIGIIAEFDNIALNVDPTLPSTITLSVNTLFSAESPTNRVYLIDEPIAYCLVDNSLYRYTNYVYSSENTPIFDGSNRVLMAEYLLNDFNKGEELPFKVEPATLQRNGIALIRLIFGRNLEKIVFSNEIQVPNVP